MSAIKMQAEDWESLFRPLANHIDPNASWQDESGRGIMFETYGDELEFIRECNPACVWTYMDDDKGIPMIVSGIQPFRMGVIGYFVTQVPVPDEMHYYISC